MTQTITAESLFAEVVAAARVAKATKERSAYRHDCLSNLPYRYGAVDALKATYIKLTGEDEDAVLDRIEAALRGPIVPEPAAGAQRGCTDPQCVAEDMCTCNVPAL